MSARPDMAVDRVYDQLAEDYTRRGYRVLRQGAADTLPPFLRDHNPRLLAERANDHVVVEVKRTRALRGGNDLTELAARVAAEPGWRLELLALGKDADEIATATEPGWLDAVLNVPNRLSGDPAFLRYSVSYHLDVVDFLVRCIAIASRLRARDKPPLRLARELTFHGVLDQDTLHRIEQANALRDALMYLSTAGASAEICPFTALCRDLHAQLLAASESNLTGQTQS